MDRPGASSDVNPLHERARPGETSLPDQRERRREGEPAVVAGDDDRGEGYAASTLKPNSYRMDQFYRWVWTEADRYTTEVTTDHADQYFEDLKLRETSDIGKNQRLKALKRSFKWRKHKRDGDSWEPLETTVAEQGTESAVYEASGTEGTEYAVGSIDASISVTDTSLQTSGTESGQQLRVEATLRNDGSIDGTYDATLSVNGQQENESTVTVPADGETK
jgi:hypothetical protein